MSIIYNAIGVKLIKKYIVAGLVVWVMLISSSFAGEKKFSLTSFIPEKFIDFKWKIEGEGGYNRRNDPMYHKSGDSEREVDNNSNSNNFKINNDLEYTNETLSKFFNINLLSSVSFTNSSRNIVEYNNYSNIIEDTDKSTTVIRGFTFNPQFNFGYYFSKNLYFRINSNYQFLYIFNDIDVRRIVQFNIVREDTLYQRVLHYYEDNITNEKMHDISVDVGLGKGKIYDGRFAFIAESIIKELKKNNLLYSEPSYDDMIDLCNIIYSFKLLHFDDSRIKRITALKAISEFLIEKSICENISINENILIQDIWDYFPNEKREFGYQFEVFSLLTYRIIENDQTLERASYYISREINDTSIFEQDSSFSHNHSFVINNNYNNRLVTSFAYKKPINYHWHLSYDLKGFIALDNYIKNKKFYTNYFSSFDVTTLNKSFFEIDYNYEIYSEFLIKYYYDNRTTIFFKNIFNFQLHKESYYDFDSDNDIYTKRRRRYVQSNLQFLLETNLIYRISIPTTFSVRLGLELSDIRNENSIEIDQEENFYTSFSISHYIF